MRDKQEWRDPKVGFRSVLVPDARRFLFPF
jgi:hypothetical protein